MRLLQKTKDGGPDSPVDAFFLCEFKGLFSIAFLRFNKGSREQFHNHAFNALTWFLKGDLVEEEVHLDTEVGWTTLNEYSRSIMPKVTLRSNMHRVHAAKTSWCFTIRGPWQNTWQEFDRDTEKTITLTHGRKVVEGTA